MLKDSSASTSSAASDDEQEHLSHHPDDESDGKDGSDGHDSDVPVLSHAEQRRQKKKQKKTADQLESGPSDAKGKSKVENTAEIPPSKAPKRQNSVWVGNLTFKTTPDAIRKFFDGVGEITRIHMPTKLAASGPGGAGARKENRGFAYVDFATPEAKLIAITLSENPLDGRRLLIKDGDDFNGRPAAADAGGTAEASKSNLSGHTKTAQKILQAQKQPAGPTLFLGNLGFETTVQSIRDLFDSHRVKAPTTSDESTSKPDAWIRKVRLGTFEDSGKCKGWAFIDFTTVEHATSALINPKNHFLDGRKLVVEYASPDAVRRGGWLVRSNDTKHASHLHGDSKEHRSRERLPRADGADKQNKRKTMMPDGGAEGDDLADEAAAESPKRRKVDDDSRTAAKNTRLRDGKGLRVRSKPGAALALAKRETAAIVPSQGQKIVF
ncbi:uncharacterized protein FIBRA_01425 [Fibroporia radiculosa]|uniref:RRM domain-containing protein n=1 Tax=Fibroporia radiculosa TaxID=599839 RepID=J4HTB9_9APHY|nr:uncharacterized protein FIBRA_01425 [Fibroporia radiculosa]CCL99407.1 predicted protein [Fibroporia radiculosa]